MTNSRKITKATKAKALSQLMNKQPPTLRLSEGVRRTALANGKPAPKSK